MKYEVLLEVPTTITAFTITKLCMNNIEFDDFSFFSIHLSLASYGPPGTAVFFAVPSVEV